MPTWRVRHWTPCLLVQLIDYYATTNSQLRTQFTKDHNYYGKRLRENKTFLLTIYLIFNNNSLCNTFKVFLFLTTTFYISAIMYCSYLII